MAFTTIPSSWLDVGDPTKKELFDYIKANEDDLDTRLTDVEAAVTNETPIVFEMEGDSWLLTMPKDDVCGIVRLHTNITLVSNILILMQKGGGAAATLEVDIKYKRGAAAWTTIYSARPTITTGEPVYQEDNGTLSVTDLNSGDLLRMDLITIGEQYERFNLILGWEVRV